MYLKASSLFHSYVHIMVKFKEKALMMEKSWNALVQERSVLFIPPGMLFGTETPKTVTPGFYERQITNFPNFSENRKTHIRRPLKF